MRRALEQKERTVRDHARAARVAQRERASAAAEAEAARAELDDLRSRFDAAEGEFAKAVAERDELRERHEASVAAAQAATEHAKQATTELYTAKGTLAAAERRRTLRRAPLWLPIQSGTSCARRRARRGTNAMRRCERGTKLLRGWRPSPANATRRSAPAMPTGRPSSGDGRAELTRRRGPSALLRRSADRTHEEAMALRFAALATLGFVCLLVLVWILAV